MKHEQTRAGKIASILFFILVAFGFIMLASAGIVDGQKKFDSSYFYPLHQAFFGLIPGLLLYYVFARYDYDKWRKWAVPILFVTIGMLVAVFIPGIGVGIRGAQRWLDFGIATVQPAEFLKLSLVLYLAAWFAKRNESAKSLASYVPFFTVLGCVALLLVLQPDFGTLGIVVLIGLTMYFFSGVSIKHFAVFIAIALVMLVVLSLAAPYRFNRIKTFLDPQSDKQGSSYHINQALISMGSGGLFGLGYGQSRQKFNYLPEPAGDSIFALMVEEIGFAGGIAFLILLCLFLLSLLQIAQQTNDLFGRLFVLGVVAWIGGQAFVNIAAISGLIPLTGVPLPLVSYGSSSLVSIMAAMGIVRNVGRV